ncbi:hypothetical protein CAK95_27010 [Pseudorhodoplanes sinuspersici]|uniref:Uncharacterized protein n=1 Tax=Pseudorhodoplanes sinuspersici TaxID=1235591 RepID=A0A1W6ZYJ0_9HYPH|nr:hypothetical protein CAK95_27010 [Pseudorhodoplanes sinuspersici]
MVASDLRRWAMQCVDQANDSRSSHEERERLMKIREGLLALADNQDWLNGRVANVSEEASNILSIDFGKPRQV